MSDSSKIPEKEITPPEVYFNRRAFLRTGIAIGSVAATAALYRKLNGVSAQTVEQPALAGLTTAPSVVTSTTNTGFNVTDEKMTSFQDVTHYNNFYEFSTDKDGVADAAKNFKTDGWTIKVDGLCNKPTTFGLDDIMKISPPEQRIYRLRCVEAWSMVVPWAGYSLSKLLDRVEPKSDAKYVAFETLLDPVRMPGQKTGVLDWPYVEGLRMDEAMHPLTLLTTGLYGRTLPPQDGAPVRLIIPWKYGFKGIKTIIKISLVEKQPPTTWAAYAPSEYGFYANVNPQVDHPRWSQATERRIGEGRRDTLMFNGYAEQVASLYAGMDLTKNF